mmetsp:Transcript_41901/g.89950  ORF Transcript_41901/g.89950 Transcript_41901/m.89950 type:complete len:769 (+) Transcript_41901:188-2494(+)
MAVKQEAPEEKAMPPGDLATDGSDSKPAVAVSTDDDSANANSSSFKLPSPTTQLTRLMAGKRESFADLRRKKLTQVDVLSAAPPLSSLNPMHILLAAALALSYCYYLLPKIMSFGVSRTAAPRPGGPFGDVSFTFAAGLSLAYISLSFLGINRMALRPLPVQSFIFECMAIHNLMQCLCNMYCFIMLVLEGRALALGAWGNPYDDSERSHTLGMLIWLQYHCRQLQLLETAFMVLRKKFQGVSFLHLYLRLLNLFGWYIACRRFGGGEAYFPALFSSGCQAIVYGLYFSFSLLRAPKKKTNEGTQSDAADEGLLHAVMRSAVFASRATRIFEVQIIQYVVCAVHSIIAAVWGNFPGHLALLHLFVIGNGLVLYTDFQSKLPELLTDAAATTLIEDSAIGPHSDNHDAKTRRVTFSFDSCGWLFVYHFGVAAFLSEYLGLEVDPQNPDKLPASKHIAFSGSSGGSLVSCVLGAGTRVNDVFEYILEQFPFCRRNPLEMFPAVERALKKFQYEGAHKRLCGRVRILLTRVTARPPFVLGEVAEHYPDNETAVEILCASCHVPFVAGIRPRKIGERYYYDGLVWPSRLLVPWRGAENDYVVRVSASASPISDVRLRRVPLWWAVLPPSPKILRGLYWCGYRDCARFFAQEPPKERSALDACRCRRPAPASADMSPSGHGHGNNDAHVGNEDTAASRWSAARALLKKEPPKSEAEWLPKLDPTTGESVAELVALAEAMADRQSAAFYWLGIAGVTFFVPVVMAALYAFLVSQ